MSRRPATVDRELNWNLSMGDTRSQLTRFAFLGIVPCLFGGCMGTFATLPEGTYEGEADCALSATDDAGGEVTEPFTTPLTVIVYPDSAMTINGEIVALGAEHVRAIPTADLTFEIVGLVRTRGRVEIVYEPRPTLTGIEVTGTLTEVYSGNGDTLDVTAEAELVITDVDGPHPLSVECTAELD